MDISKTADQFARQVQCAKEAGIYHATMLGFGALLGLVREGTLMDHDNDMDLIIDSRQITKEREYRFVKLMEDNGLFKFRRRIQLNYATQRHFWCSIRAFPDHVSHKCCNWFFFCAKGYAWHHKGTSGGKMSKVKGMPEALLEVGPKVEFLGTKIHIPRYIGGCLDWWYPDWMVKRSGSSNPRVLMKVKDWAKTGSWKVKINPR